VPKGTKEDAGGTETPDRFSFEPDGFQPKQREDVSERPDGPGRESEEVPQLTLEEVKLMLETYVQQNVIKGKEAHVWRHLGTKIKSVNRQGGAKVKRVRNALLDLELTLPPKEEFFSNRFEPEVIISNLDRVFED
jgi:hypothetical protein